MKKELMIFGIVVFVIGLFCVFYMRTDVVYYLDYPIYSYSYPFQTIGLILVVVGILVTVLGFLKKEAREEKP